MTEVGWIGSIRLAVALIPRTWRARWLALSLLGFATSGMETISAVAVLWLIQLISNAGGAFTGTLAPFLARVTHSFGIGDSAIALAAGLTVFYFMKNMLAAYSSYQQAHVAFASGAEISRALFAAYLDAPCAYHLGKNSATIQRNVGPAVDAVFNDLLYSLVGLASEVLMVAGLIGLTFFVAPLTTLFVIAALGAMTAAIYSTTQKRIYGWGAENQALNKSIIMTVEEGVGALKETKVLGRESYFIERLARARRRSAQVQALRITMLQVPRLALETLFIALVAIVLVVSRFTFEAKGGVLPLLGLYAYTGFRVMPSVARCLTHLQNIRFGSATLQDVHADFEALVQDGAAAGARPESAGRFARELRLRDVSFTFPGAHRPALRHIDLTIARGESIGIVGSTGAGKSTLLDVIAGLYEPDSGDIVADGVCVPEGTTAWQRRIGYVPQVVFLLDDTVRRNIAFGVPDHDIDAAQLARVARVAQLDEVLAEMPAGFDTLVGQHGVRLSGGQRQRIAIARALYHRPEMLLLDEATAALDNRTEHYLSEAVQQLSGTVTLVIVAHRLQTVRKCDRIVVMQDGTVVDAGSYVHLLAHSEAFRRVAAHALEGGISE